LSDRYEEILKTNQINDDSILIQKSPKNELRSSLIESHLNAPLQRPSNMQLSSGGEEEEKDTFDEEFAKNMQSEGKMKDFLKVIK
jgi:hypothetical protein